MPDDLKTEQTETEETEQTETTEQQQEVTEEQETEVKDPAERNRQGYEQRKAATQLKALQDQLDGYKRREDEARKAKLTEQQKLQEERDALAAEVEKLRIDAVKAKVAAEFKLPASLAARLIGTDEESLRADAEDVAKLLPKPKVGTTTDPGKESAKGRTYKRSELMADTALARSPEVLLAAREGRIDMSA